MHEQTDRQTDRWTSYQIGNGKFLSRRGRGPKRNGNANWLSTPLTILALVHFAHWNVLQLIGSVISITIQWQYITSLASCQRYDYVLISQQASRIIRTSVENGWILLVFIFVFIQIPTTFSSSTVFAPITSATRKPYFKHEINEIMQGCAACLPGPFSSRCIEDTIVPRSEARVI